MNDLTLTTPPRADATSNRWFGLGRRRSTPQARAIALLTEIAPRPWNLDVFVERLSARLDRRIVVQGVDMPPEMTGVWLSSQAAEYIFVTTHADCTRRVTILAHELAHLLLGHRQGVDRAANVDHLGFTAGPEQDAELVATAFVSQLDLDGRLPAGAAAERPQ